VWYLSWNIFFRNRILKDRLEFMKLLEMYFILRILLSWAILYAVLLQTAKQLLYRLVTVCSQSWVEVGVKSKDVHPVERSVFLGMAEHTERLAALGITEESSCCRYTLCQVFVIVN
jgi:hypothetical protein